MKNKIILVIQLITMYVIHLPWLIVIILKNTINPDQFLFFTKLGICLNLLMIPVVLVSLVFALLSLTSDTKPLFKTTLIIKIALVPWYVFNLIVCFLLVAGFLNPWLFLGIPLLIILEVSITYVYMLSTSIHNIAFIIREMMKNKKAYSINTLLGIVFSFIFMLDIVGAILLNCEYKRIK